MENRSASSRCCSSINFHLIACASARASEARAEALGFPCRSAAAGAVSLTEVDGEGGEAGREWASQKLAAFPHDKSGGGASMIRQAHFECVREHVCAAGEERAQE